MCAEHKLTKEQLDEIEKLKSGGDKEAYQTYVIDAVMGLHKAGEPIPPKPDPEPTPIPTPTLPADGREQFHKGANKDPNTWKVVPMRDDPALFKIVDDKDINVADLFHTKEAAQQFIDYYKWKAEPGPTPEPEPEPEPTPEPTPTPTPTPEGPLDKNGIVYLYPVKGFESYEFNDNFRSDGKRFDFEDIIGQPGCEIGAYFKINNDADDEVSGKLYGGDHNDDNPEFAHTYDIGMNFGGDRVRLRIEDEHPDYTDTIESESLNLGRFNGRWVGFRFMAFNIDNNTKCRMLVLVDNKGLNPAGKPHNAWKVVADWTDNGQYPYGPYIDYPHGESNAQQTIRVDEVGGDDDLDWYGVFCRKIDPTKPLTNIVK